MNAIRIRNFRCFEDIAVDIRPGINLLIGDNASGKTSLLQAASYAAQTFFAGFSDPFTTWHTPGQNDFREIISAEKRISPLPIEIEFDLEREQLHGLDRTILIAPPQLLKKKYGKNSRPLLSGLKEIRDYGRWLHANYIQPLADGSYHQEIPLPLIATYSTHGIHKSQKVDAKAFRQTAQTPAFGYYLSTVTDGLLRHWVRRFLILEEEGSNPLERNAVMRALHTMFCSEGCRLMQRIEPRINRRDMVCVLTDGRQVPSQQLSDGYLRLFSIALDIAFRCAMLNGLIYGAEAATRTAGTVIIDEIDLHLHPSLQAVVLKALHAAFPRLQFIVSTHAPMVMTGVDTSAENAVFHMSFDGERYRIDPVDTYGMDISSIAESVLSVAPRDRSVQQQLEQLAALIDSSRLDEARAMLAAMQSRFGDRLPELTSLETQLILLSD